MLTLLHRLDLARLLFSNPVELFDRIGRDPCYRGAMADWIDGLGLSPGARILEMGCGPGALALELAKRQFEVAAIDRSENMILRLQKAARSRGVEIAAHVANAIDTGFPDASFDAVIGASLLNIAADPAALAAEAARLTKPGGTVSFYHPNGTMNRANARRFIREEKLPPRSAAILLTWSGAARKLDDRAAEALLRGAGLEDIQSRAHLGGIVGSVTGRRAA